MRALPLLAVLVLAPLTDAIAQEPPLQPGQRVRVEVRRLRRAVYTLIRVEHDALVVLRGGYDDSLDVVGIHFLGGTWGALATGLFASTGVNPDGADGLFFGNPAQLGIQFITVIATMVFAFVLTFIILKVIDLVIGLRIAEEEEERGMDLSLHNESGYSF